MKKFRFSLRPVAVLRAHRQARAREAFAAAVHAYIEAEEHLAGVRARQRELEAAMHDGRRTTFCAADEVAFWGAYRRACEDVIGSEHALIEARTRMETRRQEYMEAHRAVKVVEKLEQKARAAHRQEIERESQQELDEMGGYRVARRLAASTVISP
jgi:flagellar protein FliJ